MSSSLLPSHWLIVVFTRTACVYLSLDTLVDCCVLISPSLLLLSPLPVRSDAITSPIVRAIVTASALKDSDRKINNVNTAVDSGCIRHDGDVLWWDSAVICLDQSIDSHLSLDQWWWVVFCGFVWFTLVI